MSKSEKFLAFEAALKESKELQEKFEVAKKRIADNKEASCDGELIIKSAAEIGFTLTMEEMERAVAQMQELSDEELKQVVGGRGIDPDTWCWFSYYCYAAIQHDDDSVTRRPCWSDYTCVLTYHVEDGVNTSGASGMHKYN